MSILKRILQRDQAQPRSPGSRPTPKPPPTIQENAEQSLPPLPRARNNYVVVVLDSCRYDSFMAAAPRTLSRLGEVERRWSYASWTSPSHYNLLMGLLPHSSPRQVYASEYYKRDFLRYNERLGAEQIEFKSLVPHLFLPTFLKRVLGYQTHALVSLPVLNPATPLNKDFDSFTLMPKHNDMAAMIERMTFSPDRPSFYLLNVGETHYPYALPSEPENQWPKIHGVHGVFKHLDDLVVGDKLREEEGGRFFDQDKLDLLRARQIEAVRYLDEVFTQLFDVLPPNTYVTVTADHGELFGEEGYFGHGPVNHPKVYEVPFVEGKVR
ncbi:MAG TPA: sulfatase-like hydrolase/transferase [Candidatus Binatia bacterium]|nr:sulfatase-like hydrolase/transferase [Candidatus Binatia bacterium]